MQSFYASSNSCRSARTSDVRSKNQLPGQRRGSALLIVMVLMGMLALLGVLFYTFAAQERSNAEYYSEASKVLGPTSLTADTLFDWALDQIIVGTDPRLTNSMLWGSRYSLLSNSLGVGYNGPGDLHPWNGEGVNLIYDTAGNVAVDQNRNGLPDDGTNGEQDLRYLLDYNDSPAALKLFDSGERQVFNGPKYFPQTDVGYTYPDINSPFLTYVGNARDQNGNIHQIVKPAYIVPALLRSPSTGVSAPLTFEDLNFNGVLDAGEDLNSNGFLDDWCVNPNMASRIMRPHPNHIYVPASGIPSSPVKRYLTDAQAIALIGPTAHGFPFHPMAATYNTTTAAGPVYSLGRMGPYSAVSATPGSDAPIEFDYDNDGDGINESILMDLDFPPQQDASGKLFVPIFLITIHDLDGLINLNAHGNLSKLLFGQADLAQANTPVANTAHPFGYDTTGTTFHFVSQSNLGLGPSEINPLWGLTARIGTDNTSATLFSQHQQFFGSLPTALAAPNPSWGETANIEFTWSKIGRMKFTASTITDLLPGTYGEVGALYQAQLHGTLGNVGGQTLPRPGISLYDDNGDINEGQNDTTPYYQHPMDYTGLGTYLNSGNPKQLNWTTPVGPFQWLSYTNYANNSNTIASSNVAWGTRANLMNNSITQGLADDPNEISFYNLNTSIDNVFTPDEMLYLNLNNTEVNRLNINSRLANLFPFNFAKTGTDNARGSTIRRKFTTESNDRKSFGLPFSFRAFGSATPPGSGSPVPGQEYSYNSISGTYEFPPQFGTIPRYQTTALSEDPFCPVSRGLLEIEWNSQQSKNRLQRKLSINQLLSQDGTNPLAFRDLTPHPADPGTAVIGSVAGVTTYPPTTVAGQEYWARKDRQRMARDIYVMLYLLGHGDDAKNTATTSNSNPSPITDGSTLYSEPQLREMAQFAVNLVDSMDRDNVITRFEYDKDLSDGWNLDDDAYGTLESTPYTSANANYNASYPNDSPTRGEVFGVERLDLNINESLVIQAKKSPSSTNYTQTNYDESSNDRFFFFTELQNFGPFPITFDSKEAWQIVLRQDANGANPAWERRLSLKNNAVIDTNGAPTSNNPYVIGSTDAATASNAFSRSTFAVDPTWAGTPSVRVAPNRATGATVMDCDLDLIEATNPATLFRIEDEGNTDITTTAGAMLSAFTGATPIANMSIANSSLKVILRRRAHPTRSYLPTANTNDNPWVEVDSMILQTGRGFRVFDMGATPNATTATTQLTQLTSWERPQPLDGISEAVSTGTGVTTTLNSLGVKNSLTVAPNNPYNLWQVHYDRSFASLLDLLYVPVFSPHQLTTLTRSAVTQPPDTQISNAVSSLNWRYGASPGTAYTITAKSAASKFMVPEDPSNTASTTPNRYLDNRWHRILELLEVPTRTNVGLGSGTALSIPRVPGKINLNTMRYSETLAALLDDSRIVSLDLNPGSVQVNPDVPVLSDNTGETARDWWNQFLQSRDPVDPYAATSASVNLPLPGLPNAITSGSYPDARPFRDIADVSYNIVMASPTTTVKHASISDTVLRSMPLDNALPAGTARRRLFEIGNQTEHQNGTVDPAIRNRLMTKLAGNTTTRSNCFGIFVSVKYFQAVEQNGAIRIGGPTNGKPDPEHRGFFVVDRSKLESGQTSNGPTYDFRAFIDYRMILQTQ